MQRSVSTSSPQQSPPSKSQPPWLFSSSQTPSPFQSRLKHPKKVWVYLFIIWNIQNKASLQKLIHHFDSQYLHILGNLTFIRVIRIICGTAEALSQVVCVFKATIARIVGVIDVRSRAEATVGMFHIYKAATARISKVINRHTIAETLSYVVCILKTAVHTIIRVIYVSRITIGHWWDELIIAWNSIGVWGNLKSICS